MCVFGNPEDTPCSARRQLKRQRWNPLRMDDQAGFHNAPRTEGGIKALFFFPTATGDSGDCYTATAASSGKDG